MITAAIVAVLDSRNPNVWPDVGARIGQTGAFQVGEALFGERLPLVLEAADPQDADAWLTWLQSEPGVAAVEVAFVFQDAPSETNASGGER
jgi:hypothetical protein